MSSDSKRRGSLYEQFFRQANDILLLHDLSSTDRMGTFIDANEMVCELLGYSRDELLGMTPLDIIEMPSPEALEADRVTLLTTGELLFDEELIAKDGRRIPVEMHARLFEHDGHQMVLSVARDITHRQRAEIRFRLASSVASDLVYEWDVRNDVLLWFGDIDAALGFAPGELGKDIASWMGRIHPEDRAQLEGAVEHHRTSTEPIEYQYRIQTKGGALRVWSDRAAPVLDHRGAPIRWVGVCTDITERTLAKEKLEELVNERTLELREAHQRFKLAAELTTDIIYEWAGGSEDIRWFGQIDEILGYEPGAFDRSFEAWLAAIHPEDRASLKEELGRNNREPAPYRGEYRVQQKDGSWLTWADKGVPVTDADGEVIKWIGACTDITAQKAAEDRLIKSEQKYRGIFDESVATVYVFDSQQSFVDSNQAGLDLLGYPREELLSLSLGDVAADPEAVLTAHEQLLNGERLLNNYEHRLRHKDGRVLTVLNSSRPITGAGGTVVGMQSTLLNITQRKRAELEREELQQQLVQAQKMEAIGTLAGGIAHDFNNIIATISGTAEITLRRLPPDAPQTARLERILRSSQRAKDLTQKLLTLARKEKLNIVQTGVNDIARDVLDMLEGTIASKVTIHSELAEGLGNITVDANQIAQALLNICINACDAMPRGGELHVRTRRQTVGQGAVGEQPDRRGTYCVISIADTGTGIDPTLEAKIFEPFFTTKERGKGSGLGLSVSHGIIKAHGGFLRLQSAPDDGATFEVFLPVSNAKDAVPEEPREPTAELVRKGRILVIDDDLEFVEMIREVLEAEGFAVRTAHSGKEGVALYGRHSETLDLVLLDMILPGMDGTEIFRALKELDPELKVILCSGYSIEGEASELLRQGAVAFMQKPFRVRALSELLSQAINGDG